MSAFFEGSGLNFMPVSVGISNLECSRLELEHIKNWRDFYIKDFENQGFSYSLNENCVHKPERI